MKADFAWVWDGEAAPGAYSTSKAISDLPGVLGMAASKFFVTVCGSPSWAETAPAVEKARARQVAAMMVRDKAIIASTLPELNRSISDGVTPSGALGSGKDSDIRDLL